MTKNRASIDIIIPCYNAHGTLARCLHSIACQTLVAMTHVILVDDCSPAGGYDDIVKLFPYLRIDVVKTEVNSGPGAARQLGMDESDGDYIVFCDADDTLNGAFALEALLNGIQGNDICVGRFVEETEAGFVHHEYDLVWVFSKMYSRRFLERFLIRFNDTRANEDTGFNTVCKSLTDRIAYINHTVYCWHWSPGTITRRENGAYTFGDGHRGYIENMAWATSELCRRNINKEIIRRLVVEVMCKLYFMHMEIQYRAPYEADESFEQIREFYQCCYKPISVAVLPPYLADAFVAEQKKYANTEYIASMTFSDFMQRLDAETEGAE